MPYVNFQRLREQLDIADVLALLDWSASGYDANGARGPCPIHMSSFEGSRTFSVNIEGNMFQCFKCGASGNALDLYAQAHGMSPHQAALALIDEFGIDA